MDLLMDLLIDLMDLLSWCFPYFSRQAKGADLALVLREAKRMEQRAEEAAEQVMARATQRD